LLIKIHKFAKPEVKGQPQRKDAEARVHHKHNKSLGGAGQIKKNSIERGLLHQL
jgi:hypothetical protein